MTAPEVTRSKMTKKQKTRLIRISQFAGLIIIILILALVGEWQAFFKSFFNFSTPSARRPAGCFTTGLKNTLIYAISAFVFGLTLGLIIALMRLSEVPLYRWAVHPLRRAIPRSARAAGVVPGQLRHPAALPELGLPQRLLRQGGDRPRFSCRGLHLRDHPGRNPGGAEGADGSGAHAGYELRPGDAQHRATAGLPGHHSPDDQRGHPPRQGLLAGLRARRDHRPVRVVPNSASPTRPAPSPASRPARPASCSAGSSIWSSRCRCHRPYGGWKSSKRSGDSHDINDKAPGRVRRRGRHLRSRPW